MQGNYTRPFTEYLLDDFEANINLYPEFFCWKDLSYYIFEQREGKYRKNWEEKVYYGTARVNDERESMNLVAQHLIIQEVTETRVTC